VGVQHSVSPCLLLSSTFGIKEMKITQYIHKYRETVRHLWNTSFKDDANWDTVDAFKKICDLIYEELILARLDIAAPILPVDSQSTYLNDYQIFVDHKGKLSLMVNREIPASGYWDYPIKWIPPEDPPDIRPICFFDFDLLGWRNFEYYRVRILKCPTHQKIEGRDALIKCNHVEIRTINAEQKIAPDG